MNVPLVQHTSWEKKSEVDSANASGWMQALTLREGKKKTVFRWRERKNDGSIDGEEKAEA